MPDGSIRWQQWSDRAIFDEQGNILYFQGVGRDITESKVAQDRLQFLHALTLETSMAGNADKALQAAARLICEMRDWDLR
ncbi:MAG: PAS domain S-box protein [Caldilineaceae bacterium]